jgi:hypothetical protein
MKRGEIMHIRILGVIPAAALTLTACGAGAVRADLRSSAASPLLSHIQEAFDFNGLPQMVATSSAVVLGHVISVKPGPVTGGTYPDQMEASGAHEGDGAVQYATATIAIENVLYGRPAISLGSQVDVLELPSRELPQSQPGDRGLFFLLKDPRDGAYRIINSEGELLVDSAGELSTARTEPDAWETSLLKLNLAKIEAAVSAAGLRVSRGEVRPASPQI